MVWISSKMGPLSAPGSRGKATESAGKTWKPLPMRGSVGEPIHRLLRRVLVQHHTPLPAQDYLVPKPTDRDDRVDQAACLARDVAPDIDVVLITHYSDVETLDTVRPGETDLPTALAVNRAVASEMLDAGVQVLVQRADRAALRRWMYDRDDTAENRRAWIDRGRLLRGSAALEV